MKRILPMLGLALALSGLLQPVVNVPKSEHANAQTSSIVQKVNLVTQLPAVSVKTVEAPVAVSVPEVAQSIVSTPQPVIQPYNGSHEDMMAAAGISPNDYTNVEWTINKESSWNVNSAEPTTGACGLAQELPCGKSGCSRLDGICQLRWADQYVKNRYGTWANEVAFHQANNYY